MGPKDGRVEVATCDNSVARSFGDPRDGRGSCRPCPYVGSRDGNAEVASFGFSPMLSVADPQDGRGYVPIAHIWALMTAGVR